MLRAVTHSLALRVSLMQVVGAAQAAFILRVTLVCLQVHLPCMLSRTPVAEAVQVDITVPQARALLLPQIVAMLFLTGVAVVQAAIIPPAKAAFRTN